LLGATFVPAFAVSGNEPEETHIAPDAAALYQRISQVAPAAGADVLFLEDEETVVFDSEGRPSIHGIFFTRSSRRRALRVGAILPPGGSLGMKSVPRCEQE